MRREPAPTAKETTAGRAFVAVKRPVAGAASKELWIPKTPAAFSVAHSKSAQGGGLASISTRTQTPTIFERVGEV
jgi:hypothetical protein